MPAATSKAELIAAFDTELAKLRKTLSGVDDATAAHSAPDDAATIKGVIAHRAHWIGMFHQWYEDGVAGREVHVPARGYKWNQLKEYNAPIYARGYASPWCDLLTEFDRACSRLRTFIEERDQAELYEAGAHPWTGKWTLGRYAEASGPAQFRSANTYVRKVLRGAA